jgi:transposase
MLNQHHIVVGVDVHKYSHTAVALNAWGKERGTYTFTNRTLPEYLAWLASLGDTERLIVGLEDANCYGTHLVIALRDARIHTRYVPAILTERERTHSTTRKKSDAVDASRVGRVLLTKYEETLPARETIATKDELLAAQELDLMLMEREDLTRSKTVLKNQLHALLYQHYTEVYRTVCPRSFSKKAIRWFQADLGSVGTILASSILRRLDRLSFVMEQIAVIDKDIDRVAGTSPQVRALTEIHGCGTLTASQIVTEVITPRRFENKHRFSAYAGVTPVPHSSGRKHRLHTNPFGNRKLNRAIHTIALSQIALKNIQATTYYEKKLKEGKTKLWALRCLKHQIAKRVFGALKSA